METEITGPKFCSIINLTKRIENSFASRSATEHRLILYRGQVGPFFQRCEETSQRNNHPCGLQAAGGPDVPAETHTIPLFVLLNELQIRCHSLKGNWPPPSTAGKAGLSLPLPSPAQLSTDWPAPLRVTPRRRPLANQRAASARTSGSDTVRDATPSSWTRARRSRLHFKDSFSQHVSPHPPRNVSASENPGAFQTRILVATSQHAPGVRPHTR